MDKWTAINTFWNSFSIPAYDAYTVPDTAQMPYITYEASIDEFGQTLSHTASLWYYSSSWSEISQKAAEIEAYIGGGAGVRYDDGRMWVTKGYPFAQRMEEPSSDLVRRIVINVDVEFQ